MTARIIAHVDMDAFYASVEIRDAPWLAGKPVVVGGPAEGRGVVSAASYEARRFGIHSAMPMARAHRLCPQLVRIDPTFAKYQEDSRRIMEILSGFSPLVEPLSLDEAFLDLSGTESALGPPREIAVAIKRRIREATRLTASVGLAPVKFVAKIASDLEKPDGLVVVETGCVREFLHPLPLSRLWGVGPRTLEALAACGLATIGDLAAADGEEMELRFGEHGATLVRLARGEDDRGVVPDAEAKSYSHEETFARDTADAEDLEGVLLDQAVRVARRLRHDGVVGRTIGLKLRSSDFRTTTRRRTLAAVTDDANRIHEEAVALFRAHWDRRPVRLIGCGVSNVEPAEQVQPELFAPPETTERRRALDQTLDQLEDRYGRGAVTRARLCPPTSAKLISEPLRPTEEWLTTDAMSRGEPGLPAGFHWRDSVHRVATLVRAWKQVKPEASGQMYLRRHYYELRMEDGATWTVYCLRQAGRSGANVPRWFLYRIG
jgi:DNA polymerase IV